MDKNDLKNIKPIPGIYCIKNNIDSKCYIGQSINVKKRLQHHLSRSTQDRYDNPIYRAFKKYGIENFSVNIVEYVDTKDFTYAKKRLDELEVKYIKQYNSYGKNGYNQTLGGDGGILGYKFTDNQRKQVSINSRIAMEDKLKTVYMYNIKHNYYQTWMSCEYAAKEVGVARTTIQRACTGKINVVKHEWVMSFCKDELESKKTICYSNTTKFEPKYFGKFIYKGSEYIGYIKDAASVFGIQKSYIYGVVNGSKISRVLSFIPIDKNIK